MLNNQQKTYSCGICKTTPDQISHHKAHLETQKHKDKRELFEMKLAQKTPVELEQTYQTTVIQEIVQETETLLYSGEKLKQQDSIPTNQLTLDEQQQIKLKQKMMEEYTAVSNKEALKDKIHEIHNFLRNNGAGYGMGALKVFNVIYGLKKIEEAGLIDSVGLARPVCEFSYLLDLANKDQAEKLTETIINTVLDSIHDSVLKHLLYYDIPKNIRASVMVFLVKEINKITLIEKACNVLLSGKIYEYFIGRDESAISELGAYFTDRHIVEFALDKLNPVLEPDGSVGSMIDMFGGSGGFTTGYINHMNEKYPKQIHWETELAKVSHFDMNEDVIKSAGLEFFCLTGVLPKPEQLFYKNSFADEFGGLKYKYPLTNPPYGGDKANKTEAQTKREKIRDYIKAELPTITDEGLRIRRQKQLKEIEAQEKQEKAETDKSRVSLPMCSGRIQKFAREHGKLKGNDKESCSLILLMDVLEEGGTALGVLKEGVFFNRQYMDLRKCLVENFNVREVISIPQDQFENTSTKTTLLIFDNTPGKTTHEVRFSELTVERYTEDCFREILGDIVIVENKGDIKGVSDRLVSTASRYDLLQQAVCSLNGKDYGKKTLVVGEGYETVKLGDICEFMPKSKRNASYGKPEGTYNFYTSSEKVQKCETADYKDECLIIGSGGVANIKMDRQFSCSADNFLLKFQHNFYVYSLLKGNMWLLSDGFTGSTLKHISKDYLKGIELPIPKSPEKIQEWVNRISGPYNKRNECQELIKLYEDSTKLNIKRIIDTEEFDEVELGSICEINPETMKTGQYNQISYIDIASVKDENINEIQVLTENFPSRAKRIVKKNDILFSTVRPNLKGYTFINTEMKNPVASTGFVVIRSKGINPKFIYSLLKDDRVTEYLIKNATGTSYPAVNSSVFEKIKVKIPKNKHLIDGMEETHFKHIEEEQHKLKQADEQYKQLIQELSREAIPEQTPVYNEVKDAEVVIPEPVNEALPVQRQAVESRTVVMKKKIVKKVKATVAV